MTALHTRVAASRTSILRPPDELEALEDRLAGVAIRALHTGYGRHPLIRAPYSVTSR